MTPDQERMLRVTYELTQENAEMLRSIRNGNRLSTAMRVIYWMVILGLSFGAYYFIQPYVDVYKETLGQVKDIINN